MAETSRSTDFSGELAAVEVLDEEKPRSPSPGVPAELVQMAAFMQQRQAGSTVGPVDPQFFQTFRIRLQGDVLVSPFTQHPWVFAGINRIATDASSVPFLILTEAPEGQFDDEMVVQSKTETPAARKRAADDHRKKLHEARRPHFDKLREAVPRLPAWFHDHHELAPARKYFRAIRSRAPEAPIGLVCKTTGVVVVEEGPWVELFDMPNRHMTRSMLWESTCIYLGEGGECFWILGGKGDERLQNEIPTDILPTGGSGWEPITDKSTGELTGWKRRSSRFGGGLSKEEKFKLHEIIQIRYFNPEHPIRGLAPIKPATLEIKQDHRASLFNNAFFVHGAQLGGVLTSEKQLNPRQVREIREQFEARHGGVTKAFKTAVLEGGVKFTETGVRQRDMQFVQLRNMSRDIILAVLGVPKSEVGVIEDVNRATAIVSKRTMWENTIIPKLTYIEDLLWSHLFRPTTGQLFWGLFDLSQVEALRDDLVSKTEVFDKLAAVGYPINVLAPRLEMGLPAVPWGNVWWAPNNLIPVSNDPTVIPPDEPPEEPPEEEPEDEPSDDDAIQARLEALEGDEDDDPDETLSDIDGLLEDGLIDAALYDEAEALISLAYDDLPDGFQEQNESRWERWDEIERQLMTPGERKIRDAVAKNLFQIRRRQMKLFNQIDLAEKDPLANAVTEPDQVLFAAKEFREKLRDRVEPIYGKLWDAAFDDAEKELDELGFPEEGSRATEDELVPNILPLGGVEEVRATLLANQQRRIMQTVDTVRSQLRTVLREAIDEGLTKAEARGRLKQAFGRLRSKPRIIGSTESASLVNGGRHTSFLKRKVPQVEWLSARDEIVRREHVVFDAAGARPLGHNWAAELGLESVVTIRRPLDPSAPARLVIGCRCTLIPSVAQPIS